MVQKWGCNARLHIFYAHVPRQRNIESVHVEMVSRQRRRSARDLNQPQLQRYDHELRKWLGRVHMSDGGDLAEQRCGTSTTPQQGSRPVVHNHNRISHVPQIISVDATWSDAMGA